MIGLTVGDRVRLHKRHPCGSDQWVVYRIGADIGLRCAGCNRRVLLARPIFEKRLKQIITSTTERGEEIE